jgi:hypothetical protein
VRIFRYGSVAELFAKNREAVETMQTAPPANAPASRFDCVLPEICRILDTLLVPFTESLFYKKYIVEVRLVLASAHLATAMIPVTSPTHYFESLLCPRFSRSTSLSFENQLFRIPTCI